MSEDLLPLYAELSRNRQARIFRHILLDEIDRTFPLLSSRLVQTEIQNGRVVVILDGFDELLRKGEETETLEAREPMLETISEFLTGSARIIITTRRTVLFDGDDFHQWLERHQDEFSLVRIKISEPRVTDWLPSDRLEALARQGINLENMANPVLLSYLRCISDADFSDVAANPAVIVDSYFDFMLERERDRQDLRMNVAQQRAILCSIAHDMVELGYTAEDRDYIIEQILTSQSGLLSLVRQQYSSADKPSKEEIANKLASHALLDRNAQETNKIGFINEFVFGNFIADDILGSKSWLCDDLRFIEPAVLSYAPRTQASRLDLIDRLRPSLEFLDISSRIAISATLVHAIGFPLTEGEAEGLSLSGLSIGCEPVRMFQFNDCQFHSCTFNLSTLHDVNFLDCRFFACNVVRGEEPGAVFILGGMADQAFLEAMEQGRHSTPLLSVTQDRDADAEAAIIDRLLPLAESEGGKPLRSIFRPMKVLCYRSDQFSPEELYRAIGRLIKKHVIEETRRSGLLTLTAEALQEIRTTRGYGSAIE
jgi:hypothetical protein